jgi:hypothetical protein
MFLHNNRGCFVRAKPSPATLLNSKILGNDQPKNASQGQVTGAAITSPSSGPGPQVGDLPAQAGVALRMPIREKGPSRGQTGTLFNGRAGNTNPAPM